MVRSGRRHICIGSRSVRLDSRAVCRIVGYLDVCNNLGYTDYGDLSAYSREYTAVCGGDTVRWPIGVSDGREWYNDYVFDVRVCRCRNSRKSIIGEAMTMVKKIKRLRSSGFGFKLPPELGGDGRRIIDVDYLHHVRIPLFDNKTKRKLGNYRIIDIIKKTR